MKIRKISLLLVAIINSIFSMVAQSGTNATEFKVERKQADGGVFYTPIQVNQTEFKFFERGASIYCFSEFFDFNFVVSSERKLSCFRLVLRDQEMKFGHNDPKLQRIPMLSKQTVYWDLDGDTIFDAMCKEDGGYILLRNTWTKVSVPEKIGFSMNTIAYSLDEKTKYIFKRGVWIEKAE